MPPYVATLREKFRAAAQNVSSSRSGAPTHFAQPATLESHSSQVQWSRESIWAIIFVTLSNKDNWRWGKALLISLDHRCCSPSSDTKFENLHWTKRVARCLFQWLDCKSSTPCLQLPYSDGIVEADCLSASKISWHSVGRPSLFCMARVREEVEVQ